MTEPAGSFESSAYLYFHHYTTSRPIWQWFSEVTGLKTFHSTNSGHANSLSFINLASLKAKRACQNLLCSRCVSVNWIAKGRKESFICLTKLLVVHWVSVDSTVQRLQNNELEKRVEGCGHGLTSGTNLEFIGMPWEKPRNLPGAKARLEPVTFQMRSRRTMHSNGDVVLIVDFLP